MCFGGSVPQDNSGAIAAQQQAQQEANVAQGVTAIDNIFGGNTVGTGAVTSYDPSQTYYNADGTVYTPAAPDPSTLYTQNPTSATPGGPSPATLAQSGGTYDPSQTYYTSSGSTYQPAAPDLSSIFSGTSVNPGQFDQSYYDNIGTNYENYYNPQLSQQYQTALNQLTLQLGQQGILQSSEADRQLGLLQQNYGTQQQTIANDAQAQEQAARSAVDQEKNTLLAQNQTAASPSLAAESAAAGAQAVTSTPTYSPLGSVFAGLLGQGTNALSIQQGGLPGQLGGSGGALTPAYSNTAAIGSGSSSSVVP